jgi:hypothetical protein
MTVEIASRYINEGINKLASILVNAKQGIAEVGRYYSHAYRHQP